MSAELDKQHAVLDELLEDITARKLFELNLNHYLSKLNIEDDVWLLGAGKAAVEMARQAEEVLGDTIKDGMVIAPEASKTLNRIQVFPGSHPFPDEDSISASYELWQLAKNIPEGDTIIFCLSGGASALFCIPASGIETSDFSHTYEILLNSGASIHEINTVRKHISETGGDKLGELLADRDLTSIILSDVPGDQVDVVGSGPTVPDTTTYKNAFHVLKKYQLWEQTPHSVRIHISKGMHGDIAENPQKEEVHWNKHKVQMISGAKTLADNVGHSLAEKGFNVQVGDEGYDMDLQKISKKMCGDAISVLSRKGEVKAPAALIYFGESTVDVKGNGSGGRNQHLALSAAISLEGQHPVSMLSLATDGVDGPTDAAGAIINSQTTLSARKKKVQPENFLQDFDSYAFHKEMGTQIKTGPTGNNLMDLQVILVGK